MKDSLCWMCNKTCGGCSWTRDFTPVKGWHAEKTLIHNPPNVTESYCVQDCPEFVPFRTFSPFLAMPANKCEWYHLWKKNKQALLKSEQKIFKAYLGFSANEAVEQTEMTRRTFYRRVSQIKKKLTFLDKVRLLSVEDEYVSG